jgi:mercuric ion transport protein
MLANMHIVRLAYIGVAWLFLACVVVQVFLAGLGVFAGAHNFALHRDFGYVFGWLTLLLLLLALGGRLGRRWIGLSTLILVLFALQSVFVALREVLPAAAALHPVNALVIFGVALHVARRSRTLIGEASGVTPVAKTTAEASRT